MWVVAATAFIAVDIDPLPDRIDVSFAPTIGYFLGIVGAVIALVTRMVSGRPVQVERVGFWSGSLSGMLAAVFIIVIGIFGP